MALVVGLILMLIITLLALSAVRFSGVGVRVATNEELRIDAFQQAQSIADAIISNPDSTPVVGNAGNIFCTPGNTDPKCTTTDLVLPENAYATEVAKGIISAQVERMTPELGPPPFGYSARCFRSATFTVRGAYDATTEGQSRSTIQQGLILPVQIGQC
ncbi:MAG: PilX N-terminal domain-containing pilus assembly protein [Sinimarinibacterium sp.]